MKPITFGHVHGDFSKVLKDEVANYFKQTGKDKTGNALLYTKTGIFLGGLILVYLILMLVAMPIWLGLLMSALLGFFAASIGFNIMHDACHGSYSNSKILNELAGLTVNLIGSNAFFWKQKHNIIHHTYTNIDGLDDDIAMSPLLRQCETQPQKPAHRLQFIYMFFLYGISSIYWALYSDFQKYFSDKINNTKRWKMPVSEHIIFWVSKLFYVVIYMVLPIYVHGFWTWLPAYLVMNLVFGVWLSIVFQLAHVVEETSFEEASVTDAKKIDDWVVHQLRTTADFAPKNKVLNFLVGGLNFQVEHHLFPHISHVHYPAIQKIVSETCAKFNIPYHCNPSMVGAIGSHVRRMKYLGRA